MRGESKVFPFPRQTTPRIWRFGITVFNRATRICSLQQHQRSFARDVQQSGMVGTIQNYQVAHQLFSKESDVGLLSEVMMLRVYRRE